MKILTRDYMPCWYELSWQGKAKPSAIILRVHKDFIAKQEIIPETAPIIEYFKKEFELKTFCGDFKGNFGFESAFKKQDDCNNFSVFCIELPLVKKQETKICSLCSGSGKDFTGDNCFSCGGSGKENVIDWHDAFAVSVSLTVFFQISYYIEIETSAKTPQLLTVETITERGMHGGSLHGIYSVPLVKWLSAIRGNVAEMVTAMTEAYDYMFGLDSLGGYDFRASVDYDNGWLNVTCPGNACGLNPSSNSTMRDGRGYEFSCHNTDSPMQQLTLLAGLAALHDKALKEIGIDPKTLVH
ncbi:MAG: hypothetical protein HYX20_04055 [Candidatus Yanofskybacteria bacterium]|nr:hypothetical protein [Candidatus Yanofskybacteria bacterium]